MKDPDENRPDPDELLASLMREEEKSRRGKLKIFFGMCAGVGKTYTMLKTASSEKLKGVDIITGYVETHNRKETAELAAAFDIIERRKLEYKSTVVQEMDIDAILARKPQTVLVDELAHTNAPGSRHAKRYQDVLEILENGINVYTSSILKVGQKRSRRSPGSLSGKPFLMRSLKRRMRWNLWISRPMSYCSDFRKEKYIPKRDRGKPSKIFSGKEISLLCARWRCGS
jgi:hypothetical protein